MDNLVGRHIGNYRIVCPLGHGGFGKVYKAEDIISGSQWAIKIPLEQYLMNPKFQKGFIREVQILANLNHDNIVPISDKGQQGELLYYVMPFYKNGTLEDRIKGRSLSLDEVEHYLMQMCSALGYLHTQGVAHLDFKPANLLIDDDHLRLADFGLAHIAVQGKLVGGTSLQSGTAQYMAPEQIQGKPCHSSDIYALGITLYQMLTGHVPFGGNNEHEIKDKHINKAPPPLRRARPDMPQALQQVLVKALAKNPQERYQSAMELLADFKAACSGYVAQPHTSKTTNALPPFSLDPSLVKVAGVAALGGGAIYLAATQKIDKELLLLALLLLGAFALILSFEMGKGEAGQV